MFKGFTLTVFAAALLFAGCATPNPSAFYIPAKSASDNGYSAKSISLSQYQISFRGPASLGQSTVENLALLRAAEFTLEKNHSWFKLIRRDTAKIDVPRKIEASVSTGTQTTTCGAGTFGCTSNDAPNGIAGVNINNSPNAYDSVFVCVLQIELGDGPMPSGDNVMDAKETAARLRASLLAAK